ncbi:TIGR01244 family sulfur transferase [Erythrobacter sp. HKB08]|uniref:TIGR01244 family sulfur transferase n=1 Tax=Erythrobacter sp. HKB08 TaxID=2502843 RepID=UPI0010093303|nr:TIGR01244 family sulfur transferase [Erythrobacter sp. HKB08]
MSDFRKLSDSMYASPQIDPAQVAEAKALGIAMIVNNRPDGEAPDQPEGAAVEQAAKDAGIAYRAIPVGGSGFGEPQVTAMLEALDAAEGPVLAFCRSGTRSTLLWSLAQAAQGGDPDAIAAAARQAGYDITPVRMAMDVLAQRAKG